MVLGDVQYLVVDEADTMFDQGFGPELMKLIAPLKARRGGAALATVLVSATINGPLRQLIRHEFPGMVTAQTTSLHKGITGSRHTFVPIEAGGDRLHALTQVRACLARVAGAPPLYGVCGAARHWSTTPSLQHAAMP